MEKNIILAGVGGQGILSIAFVIDHAAMDAGFNFKQAEVHGMAQRGGSVQSHLRFSASQIYSDLIPHRQPRSSKRPSSYDLTTSSYSG